LLPFKKLTTKPAILVALACAHAPAAFAQAAPEPAVCGAFTQLSGQLQENLAPMSQLGTGLEKLRLQAQLESQKRECETRCRGDGQMMTTAAKPAGKRELGVEYATPLDFKPVRQELPYRWADKKLHFVKGGDYYFSHYVNDYLGRHPEVDPNKISAEALAQAAMAEFNEGYAYLGGLTPESQADLPKVMRRQAALAKLYRSTTDEQWRAVVAELNPTMDAQEKMDLLAKVGRDLLDHYDHGREATPFSNETVPLVEMLKAQNTADPKGVCRDISSGMGEMAQALGFKDVCVLSFQNQTLHTTLLMKDPSKDGEIIKYSYDARSTSPVADGVRAFEQSKDVGFNYYCAKPAGRSVLWAPTELQNLVTTLSGGNIREYSVFARNTAPAVAQFQICKSGDRACMTAFAAYLSNGQRVAGALVHKKWGDPDRVAATQAAAGVMLQHDSKEYSLSAAQIYLRFTQYLNTPWLGRGGTQLRGATTTTVSGNGGSVGGYPSGFGNGFTNVGIEARHCAPADKTCIEAEAKAQIAMGQSDTRNTNPLSFRPFLNQGWVGVNASQLVSPDTRVSGGLDVGANAYGKTVRAEAGVENASGTKRVVAGYQGGFAPDQLLSPRDVYVAGEMQKGSWTLGAELRKTLASERLPELRLGAKKSLHKQK
jgi:hypothetical protein